MTTLPDPTYVTDVLRTVGEKQQAERDLINAVGEMLGGAAEANLEITTGSVTPTNGVHAIDTEAQVASDDLDRLSVANHPDGRLLLIHSVSNDRTVVAKHAQSGSGEILLQDSRDFPLSGTHVWLVLKRTGNSWTEVMRSEGLGVARVSSGDTSSANLDDKIVAGEGILSEIVNAGGDEDLRIKVDTAVVPRLAQPNEFSKQQSVAKVALVDGANIAWNLDDSNVAEVTLAANRTLDNPTNMKSGGTYLLIVRQDATGGRALSYGTNYDFAGGIVPTLSTDASAVDILTFISDGSRMYGAAQFDFK